MFVKRLQVSDNCNSEHENINMGVGLITQHVVYILRHLYNIRGRSGEVYLRSVKETNIQPRFYCYHDHTSKYMGVLIP